MNIILKSLTISFFSSAFICLLIILTQKWHNKFSGDNQFQEPQKFHKIAVPRIGGLAIFLAIVISFYMLIEETNFIDNKRFLKYFLVCMSPVFAGGFFEDITKKVNQLSRLLLSFSSAMLGYFLLGAILDKTGFNYVDINILNYKAASLFITIIAVGGICHAINIIDGFNGLMLLYSIFVFIAFSFVCYNVQDFFLLKICIIYIGAILGLFIFNFPFGKIFAGDCGAYLIGYSLGTLALIIVAKNNKVSPMFAICMLSYPIIETLASIIRRTITKGESPFCADGKHLHTLILKEKTKNFNIPDVLKNSMVSPYMWGLSLLSIIPASLFWDNDIILLLIFVLHVTIYLFFYNLLHKKSERNI